MPYGEVWPSTEDTVYPDTVLVIFAAPTTNASCLFEYYLNDISLGNINGYTNPPLYINFFIGDMGVPAQNINYDSILDSFGGAIQGVSNVFLFNEKEYLLSDNYENSYGSIRSCEVEKVIVNLFGILKCCYTIVGSSAILTNPTYIDVTPITSDLVNGLDFSSFFYERNNCGNGGGGTTTTPPPSSTTTTTTEAPSTIETSTTPDPCLEICLPYVPNTIPPTPIIPNFISEISTPHILKIDKPLLYNIYSKISTTKPPPIITTTTTTTKPIITTTTKPIIPCVIDCNSLKF